MQNQQTIIVAAMNNKVDLGLSVMYLKKHQLFKGLDDEQVEVISGLAKRCILKRKEKMLVNGYQTNGIYFLIQGKIKISIVKEDDPDFAYEVLYPGDIFGNITLTEFNQPESAQALTMDTLIYSFQVSDFKWLLKQYHQLTINYSERLSKKLVFLKSKHAVWANKSAKQRLSFFFKNWAEKEGKAQGDYIILNNFLPLSDIADILSISRQLMYIILNELEEQNLLCYRKEQIVLNKAFVEQ